MECHKHYVGPCNIQSTTIPTRQRYEVPTIVPTIVPKNVLAVIPKNVSGIAPTIEPTNVQTTQRHICEFKHSDNGNSLLRQEIV
jgi:hypothetical protein